jgi:hypothetical protein
VVRGSLGVGVAGLVIFCGALGWALLAQSEEAGLAQKDCRATEDLIRKAKADADAAAQRSRDLQARLDDSRALVASRTAAVSELKKKTEVVRGPRLDHSKSAQERLLEAKRELASARKAAVDLVYGPRSPKKSKLELIVEEYGEKLASVRRHSCRQTGFFVDVHGLTAVLTAHMDRPPAGRRGSSHRLVIVDSSRRLASGRFSSVRHGGSCFISASGSNGDLYLISSPKGYPEAKKLTPHATVTLKQGCRVYALSAGGSSHALSEGKVLELAHEDGGNRYLQLSFLVRPQKGAVLMDEQQRFVGIVVKWQGGEGSRVLALSPGQVIEAISRWKDNPPSQKPMDL